MRSDRPSPIPPVADSVRSFAVLLFGRTTLNLQYRIVYPFLPAISRGFGLPLETVTLLLTVRSFVAALSPVDGSAADRHGRRPIMLAGLVALTLGAVLTAIAPGLGVALIAFALLGLMMALNVSAAALGRMAGSLTGPQLWGAEGLVGVALVSAGLSIAATLILWTTRER